MPTNSPTTIEQVIERVQRDLDVARRDGLTTNTLFNIADVRELVEALSRNTPVDSEVERLRSAIETERRKWFCSGADCAPYDHGRDEGFDFALKAFDEAIASLPPKPVDGAPGVNCPDCGGRIASACPHCGAEPIEIAPVDGEVAELVETLNALQQAEATYRYAHDILGTGDPKTGRAWDLMRRAGDKARDTLAMLSAGEKGTDDAE